MPHIERIAEAGVGVDNDRQRHRIARCGGVRRQVAEVYKAQIGHAVKSVGQPAPLRYTASKPNRSIKRALRDSTFRRSSVPG